MPVFNSNSCSGSTGGLDDVVTQAELLVYLEVSAELTEAEKAVLSAATTSAWGAIKRHLGYEPTMKTRTEMYPRADFSSREFSSVWEVGDDTAYLRNAASAVGDLLQVSHLPIRSIESLCIDYDGRFGGRVDAFSTDTEKTEGEDFWMSADLLDSSGNRVCKDGIIRSMGSWPSTPGSVRIVYTAGYSVAELHGTDSVIDATPIRDAVIDETIRRVHRNSARAKKAASGFAGPLSSENLGDYSYSVDAGTRASLAGGADLAGSTIEKLADFVRYDLGVM
jgi:hypothetical protein